MESIPFILLACVFIAIIFAMIVVIYRKSQRDRLSDFSPEQRNALSLQNKALILWVLAVLFGVFVLPLLGADSFPKDVVTFVTAVYVLLGGGIMFFIAISSIVSRVSIFRPRGQWEYSQDEQAVYMGKAVLLILAAALLLWFISKYS